MHLFAWALIRLAHIYQEGNLQDEKAGEIRDDGFDWS